MQPGALITAVNGHPIHSFTQLEQLTRTVTPGQVVRYTSTRAAPRRSQRSPTPRTTKHAIIGIGIVEQVRVTHLPVHVKFLFHDIGGPSAGLAFTLDIYDALSGRHLLDGHRIAVTGTISLDGQVGPIGGIKQKTIGAIQAGADTFLVPAGDNYRGALAEAHGRIKIISVKSFQQALRAIRALPPGHPQP